ACLTVSAAMCRVWSSLKTVCPQARRWADCWEPISGFRTAPPPGTDHFAQPVAVVNVPQAGRSPAGDPVAGAPGHRLQVGLVAQASSFVQVFPSAILVSGGVVSGEWSQATTHHSPLTTPHSPPRGPLTDEGTGFELLLDRWFTDTSRPRPPDGTRPAVVE